MTPKMSLFNCCTRLPLNWNTMCLSSGRLLNWETWPMGKCASTTCPKFNSVICRSLIVYREKDKLSSVGNDQPDGQVSIIRASYITISSHSSCTVPSVFKSVCCENTHIITAQSIPVAPGTSNALQCSRKLARQFIAQLSGSSLYQLTINPGETVTVQVPTSPGATGSLSPCCQEGLLGGPCVR